MEAFCFKCRGKHELLDPKPIFFKNGSPATQGTCSNCGSDKVFKMGRTPLHEGLTPPEVVHTPRKPKKSANGKGKAGQKPLVIVESPTKARTIGKFLGRKYHVEASIGHIRDLPKNRLGVDVDANFEPRYCIPVAKKDVVKELKGRAKEASEIWLATDPDREGEAISWHLTHVLSKAIEGKAVRRVEFHEITPHAISEAFANPRNIDRNLVDAQQARRILDRLVGYTLSPLLRDKMGRKGLSAGRVQSVALRLVVERERAIDAFAPVEYWTIEAELEKELERLENGDSRLDPSTTTSNHSFIARLYKVRGADPDLKSEADAQQVTDALEGTRYSVIRVDRKDRTRRPAAPFTTSTMQQEASRKLGFNARKTMSVAQQLYEGIDVGDGPVGLITYMRTDSTNVATSAQAEARELIEQRYGGEYLPEQPPKYTSRSKNAQEAHEAVRPTSVLRAPEEIKAHLERDQHRLYDLIWKRFVASQMANAVFDATTVDIDAQVRGGEEAQGSGQAEPGLGAVTLSPSLPLTPSPEFPLFLFRATGSIIKFSGFLKVYEEGRDEGDTGTEDDEGRDRRLPELSVDERLDLLRLIPAQHFTQPPPRYTEASLIKALEEDGIGRPSTYATIMTIIQSRNYVTREGKQLRPTPLGLQVNDLLVSNFPRYINVGFTAHVEDDLDSIETGEREWRPVLHEFYDPFKDAVRQAAANIPQYERIVEYTGENCPECGSPLAYKDGRFGRFIGCTNFPKCKHVEPIALPGVTCPLDGGKIVEKRMRKGRRVFYGCANYPNCEFTTWNRPIPMPCPTGDGGLMVDVGKGKAKCLKCEQVFEIEDAPELAAA